MDSSDNYLVDPPSPHTTTRSEVKEFFRAMVVSIVVLVLIALVVMFGFYLAGLFLPPEFPPST